MSNNIQIKAVILDIDGTLTDEVSWLSFTKQLGADPRVHTRIFDEYKTGNITYPESRRQLIRLWNATGNASKKNIINCFYKISIRKPAISLVEYLRKSYKLCLISGSMDLYVKTVAKRLNIPNWYANTILKFDGNNNLYSYDYFDNQAKKKYEQFIEYTKRYAIKSEEVAVIGNSENDSIILEKSGLPILIITSDTSTTPMNTVRIKIRELDEVKKYL